MLKQNYGSCKENNTAKLNSSKNLQVAMLKIALIIEIFRSEDDDDYEYEFSVLSTRTSKNVDLQTLCACAVRKTRTRCRHSPPI